MVPHAQELEVLSAGDIKRLLTREGVSYWVAFGTFSHNVALVSESKSDEHLSLVDEIPAVWLCGRMEQAEIIVRAFFRVVSPEGPDHTRHAKCVVPASPETAF